VHPIHTEVVDWIAAFPDAFTALLVVLAAWLFVRQNGSPRGFKSPATAGSIFSPSLVRSRRDVSAAVPRIRVDPGMWRYPLNIGNLSIRPRSAGGRRRMRTACCPTLLEPDVNGTLIRKITVPLASAEVGEGHGLRHGGGAGRLQGRGRAGEEQEQEFSHGGLYARAKNGLQRNGQL
jgi:hypothetical protein